eukprot:CAMPEP_0173391364 /NCGR_PEP_ID=MMETSP1356-20130122/18338_1 /TAXON_ID=77927 ORGANISM="Hemiselmis virescens, Strain PCC157" /NCGR_SAMPLE_ID=MMETSP1356 /ASSEMBLY_ACC=CAM_ASM_000847 /LENGTH=195 /DNA_ID=CAMNT_0014348977 /DNA_START=16 /DNA_END=600 /DNA_ORIENTATION=+
MTDGGSKEMAARRGATAFMLMALGAMAVCVFVATSETQSGSSRVVLAVDCGSTPWVASCHRPSLMDMINGIGHKAQNNAIRQKQVKEALLKQEKAQMSKLAAKDAIVHKKQAEEAAKSGAKASGGASSDSKTSSKSMGGLEGKARDLKSTVYKGLDIGSRKAVDGEMATLLKKKGPAAVQKKVDQIREQILADSG